METLPKNSLLNKIKKGFRKHLVDSTALVSIITPIAAAYETFWAGMSNDNSINTRLLAAATTYAGLGTVYAKGMDISRNIFKIKSETKEKIKQLHDACYGAAYCLAISPAFYLAAGVRDFKQIAIGTVAGMGLGAVMGVPAGYAVNLFRDFTGLEPNNRIPSSIDKLADSVEKASAKVPPLAYCKDKLRDSAQFIRNARPKTKKGLVALLVGSSVALTAGIYYVSPHHQDINPQNTQQVITTQARN